MKSVQCPECRRKTEPKLKGAEFYCNGKWTPDMIGHKKLQRMK